MSSGLAKKTVPRSPLVWGEHHMNPVSPSTHFYSNVSFHPSFSHFFCISSCSREQQSIMTQRNPHRNRNYSQKRPQRNEILGNGLTFRRCEHSEVPNLNSEIRLPLGFLSNLYRIGRKKSKFRGQIFLPYCPNFQCNETC